MSLSKRLMTVALITFACAGCDQGTKSLAGKFLPKGQMSSYLYDTVRIGYTENTGAMLGLGSDWPDSVRFIVFTVIASAMMIGLLVYMLSARINFLSCIGLALIFGGGASNLVDRIFNDGAVVDFLNVGLGPLRTGIFNVADMALMLGTALFLYAQYFGKDVTDEAS